MSNKDKEVEFKGRVVRSIYDSPTFRIYAFDVDKEKYPHIKQTKYGNVSCLGELPELGVGVTYEITAEEQDSKHGISYKVSNIRRNVPTSAEDTKIFLEEILTENQADVLYENYPNIVELVKEGKSNTVDLSRLHGIGEKTFAVIVRKIEENFKLADLVVEFNGILSLNMIKKIYDKYSSVDVLKTKLKFEPYSTLTKVSGIGFKTADAITLELQEEGVIDFGYDVRTSEDRCYACILYLLQENENDGNTKMNLAELRKQCINMVPAAADNFTEAIKSEDIYYNKIDMDVAIRSTYETEKYIAETIVSSNKNDNKDMVWDFDVEKYRDIGEFTLSDEQMNAISNVCKYTISILNGFAGSGKSASTQAIINMLEDNGKSYVLMAPTGKASKVIAEYTGRPASTIHRGLGFTPPNKWTYNKIDKLHCDIIIVDEASMCDILLFGKLIDAIDFKHTKLLLIGDSAQLPSVSCGNLLHDLLQSGIVPTTTLTRIFRYSSGGLMKAATDVRNSKRYLDGSMRNKVTVFGDNEDYIFIDLSSESIPKHAVALYKKLLDKGNSVKDIQVLTSKNKGDYGCVTLNNMLQKVANKNYGKSSYMKVGDTTYYKGDMVIAVKNNYDAELHEYDAQEYDMYDNYSGKVPTAFIANGDQGTIVDVFNSYVVIDFDGIIVRYYRDDMSNVKLGYAITCHKSQGSSIKNVIVCTPQSDIFMLNSNLIYVAITRTKDKCYHLGSVSTINKAIDKKANFNRHTFLQKMLLDMC